MFASSVLLVFLLWCQLWDRSEAVSEESHGADGLVLRNGMSVTVPSNNTESRSPATVWETRIKGETVQRITSAADRSHTERLLMELRDYRFVFPYIVSGKRKRSLAALQQNRDKQCAGCLPGYTLNPPQNAPCVNVICPHNTKVKVAVIIAESYPDHVSILVELAGEQLTLDLSRNILLLPRGFRVSHYDPNGTLVTEQHQEPSQCYYEGSVRSFPGSAVSASTCSGLSALVVLGNRTYVIEHLGGAEHGRHLMYRPEDLKSVPSRCGVTNTSPGSALAEELQQLHRMKKMELSEERKYVELVLVADNAEYLNQRKNKDAVVKRMLAIANTVDLYYRPLNVRIALIGVEVWTRDQVTVDRSPQKMLSRFLQWRKSSLLPRHYNDNAQLILGRNFEGSTTGLAPLSTICLPDASGGVNEDSELNILRVSATVAHELGHNLGLSHDTRERKCVCPSKADCIMAETLGLVLPTKFSSCSQADLARGLLHGKAYCLFNLPKLDKLIGGPKCGNMYLEKGEQCDCGKPKECSDPCCEPSTCRLRRGAKCSSVGACCKKCKLLPAGTVCRPKRGECDLPEFCTGRSQECPDDHYVKDGHTCSNGNLYCSQGTCQSADRQCQEIWGASSKSAEKICYEVINEQGNEFGNCGHDKDNNYVRCQAGDEICGKIQCKIGKGATFPGGTTKIVTSSIVNKGVKYECWAVLNSLSDANSPDWVKQGTKCGDNKACIDGKCQDVALFNVKSCDKTCNNNGVCNNNNNCHCDDGWAPPFCKKSGWGGSKDSGPGRALKKEMINPIPLAIAIIAPATALPILSLTLQCQRKKRVKARGRSAVKTVRSGRSRAPLAASPEVQSSHLSSTV